MGVATILFNVVFWGISLGVLLIVGLLMLRKWSFRFRCIIAKQIGEGKDDVIIMNDRFKVRKENDYYVIIFDKNRGKTVSPLYEAWCLFMKKPVNIADNEFGKFNDKQIKKLLIRGAMFYMSAEGEINPVVIRDKEIEILGQDNRAFILEDIQREKEFMTTTKDKLIQAMTFVVPIICVTVLMIFAVIYFNTTLQANVAEVCGNANNLAQADILAQVRQAQEAVGG